MTDIKNTALIIGAAGLGGYVIKETRSDLLLLLGASGIGIYLLTKEA